MKKISLRLPDATFEMIEMNRGEKTVSEYVRSLIEYNNESARNESTAFQKLFSDVSFIKESLNASLKNLTTKKDLLALSSFFAEVASMANPPAYSHHKTEMQQLYQALSSKMHSEG
jgi:hypothetical protein